MREGQYCRRSLSTPGRRLTIAGYMAGRAAQLEAEAQRVFEEEERRAGVPEARPLVDHIAVRATVAMLLATKRKPQGLRELGHYAAAYGPLNKDPELMAVASFHDAVEKEYWRQCSDPINVKSDEFDILFDRNGDVCIGEGENHICDIPARVIVALAAVIDNDNKISGWLDRIYRQLNPLQKRRSA